MTISHEWFTWECPYCDRLQVTVGEQHAREELLAHIRQTADGAHDELGNSPADTDPDAICAEHVVRQRLEADVSRS